MGISAKVLTEGALPYDNIPGTNRMVYKLFEKCPGLFMLPNISKNDLVDYITLDNIPGTKYKDGVFYIRKTAEDLLKNTQQFNTDFENPEQCNLEDYSSEIAYLKDYLKIIHTTRPPHACFEILGPLSISYSLINSIAAKSDMFMLADRVYRKFFVEIACLKALWLINKIKSASKNTTPIVILHEPFLNHVGEIKRQYEDFSQDTIRTMLTKTIETIKGYGAIVVIQCFSKCDWQIPIDAGVDIISFDAYNNQSSLTIFSEKITEFLSRGGKINWAIVPTTSGETIKTLSVEYLLQRLTGAMEELISSGVPRKLVYKSATVSLQGDINHLPLIFAEKALILTKQLGDKLSTLS